MDTIVPFSVSTEPAQRGDVIASVKGIHGKKNRTIFQSQMQILLKFEPQKKTGTKTNLSLVLDNAIRQIPVQRHTKIQALHTMPSGAVTSPHASHVF